MNDLFIENEMTRQLDQALEKARSGELGDWAPFLVIDGLPGSGKTSIVKEWLEHNKVKNIFIDATQLSIQAIETETTKANSIGKGVYSVNDSELTDLLTPIKQQSYVIFDSNCIDEIDKNTAIIIDNYDRASKEVRNELCKLYGYQQVVDIREGNPERIKKVYPLLLVLIVDTLNIMEIPLNEIEKQIFEM